MSEQEKFICPECGQEMTHAGYLKLHVERFHDPQKRLAPEANKTDAQGRALIPDWRQSPRLRVGLRSLTMLRPICRSCQGADNAGRDWYQNCKHEPYVTITERKEDVPEMVDEMVDGEPTGRRIISKITQAVSYHPRPNIVGIELSMGSNSGMGPSIARAKGYIFPSQLRSRYFPNGIADTCEFVDCRKQTDLKVYETQTENGMTVVGRFCRKEEAQLVWYHSYANGGVIEVGEWSPEARQNRTRMLAEAQVQPVSA